MSCHPIKLHKHLAQSILSINPTCLSSLLSVHESMHEWMCMCPCASQSDEPPRQINPFFRRLAFSILNFLTEPFFHKWYIGIRYIVHVSAYGFSSLSTYLVTDTYLSELALRQLHAHEGLDIFNEQIKQHPTS